MTESGTDSGTTTWRHTVVGAFDHAAHAERARHDLAAVGYIAERVATAAGAGTATPGRRVDPPGRARGAAFGRVKGWLAGRTAAVGAVFGRPAPAWDARAASHLLLVRVGGDSEERQARALLALAGATRTWAYRVPPQRAAPVAVPDRAAPSAALAPARAPKEAVMSDSTISTIRPDRDDGGGIGLTCIRRSPEGGTL